MWCGVVFQKAKDHDILYSVVWNAQETIDRFLESVDSTLRALETSDAVSQADPEITPGYMVEYGRKRLRDIPLEQPFPKNFKKRFPDFPDHGVRFVRVDTALADFVFHDRGQLEEPDSLPQIGLITIINAPDQLADFILGNHDLKLPRPLVISLLDKLGSIVRTKSLSSK